MKEDRYITKKQALAELCVSYPTLLKYVKSGVIKRNMISPRVGYYSLNSILALKSGKKIKAEG